MNNNNIQDTPVQLVILGATGDLTTRKLMPALYNLYIDKFLPKEFFIWGIARNNISCANLKTEYWEGLNSYSRRKPEQASWDEFAKTIDYTNGDLLDDKLYVQIDQKLSDWKKSTGGKGVVIFYLAISPVLFAPVVERIGQYKLKNDREKVRFIFEKPFGNSPESASELNKSISKVLKENQIFRIDHYLGKETVQNILAFRFANAFFEPLWNRNYIDWVQISGLEDMGVEERGGYYDGAGALRDMIQNHIIQLMCMIAMEPPITFEPDEIRNKKVDVLKAIRFITEEQVHQYAIRGQYGAKGDIKGYRQEDNVKPDSKTETYAAVKFYIDNWRWEDVPFYVRTGKMLAEKSSMIVIKFKRTPIFAFPKENYKVWESNFLIIHISPQMDINLSFYAKEPGQDMKLKKVDMVFDFHEELRAATPEAYEHLIFDVIENDPTLFMRMDQVELSWRAISSILKVWQTESPGGFPNYQPGSYGPTAADKLLAQDGNIWHNETK
jgi:glucose-6-phosphate 1-dehydrogenase